MEEQIPFTVFVTERGLKITGEVDMSTAPLLVDAVLAAPASRLDLDLSEVTFMDSSGLHALTRIRALPTAARVTAVSPSVQRVFALAGMTQFLLDAASPLGVE